MSGSVNSGDMLGGDLGRWAVALCVVAAVLLLVPIGLASVGFGAILAVIGGPQRPSITGNAGQVPIGGTMPTTSLQPVPMGVGPIQSVIPAARGLLAGWADRGPLNQYARISYRSDQSWTTWRNADCSAAALDWLLGAYGQQLGSLDDAIALVGPGTGISPSLGLLDARGPALARALASRGLSPREPRAGDGQLKPLASVAELEAWLNQGPLLMDGARWFGEGHWFVGIGYDRGGIFIRDSSGWDNRYLSWSRLYGEVGFSGWVVGVAP
jgi:hypothetical protein